MEGRGGCMGWPGEAICMEKRACCKSWQVLAQILIRYFAIDHFFMKGSAQPCRDIIPWQSNYCLKCPAFLCLPHTHEAHEATKAQTCCRMQRVRARFVVAKCLLLVLAGTTETSSTQFTHFDRTCA